MNPKCYHNPIAAADADHRTHTNTHREMSRVPMSHRQPLSDALSRTELALSHPSSPPLHPKPFPACSACDLTSDPTLTCTPAFTPVETTDPYTHLHVESLAESLIWEALFSWPSAIVLLEK